MHAESAASNPIVMARLERLSAAVWIIFAAVLPFELKTPLITLGPLSITNVEVALYGVIGLWIARVIVARRWGWTPVHWAVLAWIAANVISAVFAPTLRGEAIKFAFRALTGALVFLAAAEWAQTPGRVLTIALTLSASTLVSASAGVIEVAVPATAPLWLAFKTHVTVVGEVLRASGTFQYANTAAMFWEAALPIGVASSVAYGWPRSRRGSIGLAAAVSFVALAIVLSASRAALLGSAVALLSLIVPNHKALRRGAAVALGSLIALTAAQIIASPAIAARFQAESDRTWYSAQVDVAHQALTLRAAEVATVPVTVTNTSVRTWLAGGNTPVRVSYHWLDAESSEMIIFDGLRTPLPGDLAPGEQVIIGLRVQAPEEAGEYQLQIDLTQEKVTWFSTRTGQATTLTVRVGAARSNEPADASAAPRPATTVPRPLPSQTRTELWRVAIELWRTRPVLGIGPDNFRWTYGAYLGATHFDRTVTANSWYVETLVNTGVLGLASLIGLGATLLRAAYRAVCTRSDVERPLVLGLIAALLAFAVHGVVDYFLPFTPTYGLFWLTAGLLTARAWSQP